MDERFNVGQMVIFISPARRARLGKIVAFCDDGGRDCERVNAVRVRIETTSKMGAKFQHLPTTQRVGLLDDELEEGILERHLDELQGDARRVD